VLTVAVVAYTALILYLIWYVIDKLLEVLGQLNFGR